ncbi:multiple resistance and pH regulation protein F [Candidatus Moduliflexus flocculans]|uniref:Multiple resistance and pH regulation protein F n=1 Tax=Candidatus Moduliflexus flocculans TaxID=1499966 RepID=A0A081BNV3_9BACT|nr:multiple resistance and pH regulation protein F [Candidatus Moduliflexus flocculans]
MILSFDIMIYFFLFTTVFSMIRIVIGPSAVDRMIGLNLVSAQVLAMFVLLAVKERLAVYLDVALVYAVFGFVGMLAIARYFGRR